MKDNKFLNVLCVFLLRVLIVSKVDQPRQNDHQQREHLQCALSKSDMINDRY